MRPPSLLVTVVAITAALAACSTDPTDAAYIPRLSAPVPEPDPRWGFQPSTENDGATVQFVAAAPDDARETVEATHAWYEDLMYDVGWNKQGEEPANWSSANRAYTGTTFWQEYVDDRPRGVMIWVTGNAARVILRIYCCDASAGDPGP